MATERPAPHPARLVETVGQVGWSFWDQDIIDHAIWLFVMSGRRRRVVWDPRRGRWVIRHAIERSRR